MPPWMYFVIMYCSFSEFSLVVVGDDHHSPQLKKRRKTLMINLWLLTPVSIIKERIFFFCDRAVRICSAVFSLGIPNTELFYSFSLKFSSQRVHSVCVLTKKHRQQNGDIRD